MNEFYITTIKRKAKPYIGTTVENPFAELLGTPVLQIKLESAGAFDEAEIKRAMDEGKRVKIQIVE